MTQQLSIPFFECELRQFIIDCCNTLIVINIICGK